MPANDHLVNRIIAFAYSLKHELRNTDPTQDLVRLLGEDGMRRLRAKCYGPTAILDEIRYHLAQLQMCELVSETKLWMLDVQINELGKTVGGCERIASTPIPFAYGVLLHRTVYAYCVMLPFGLVDSTELFTPIICVFVAHTLIALEAIADEISEPFSMARALAARALQSRAAGAKATGPSVSVDVVPMPTPASRNSSSASLSTSG
ncbi:hypothetical protein OR16_01605 [Cupriavidus basilensis OR16]|uniref:Uncharacterized protein n=1 Tax=Cupriavidus basilensis OR16 TaxID=1127483 RepID=H1RYI9_9BURK|nr:hypothetical protein OR16_01605 [Cupriavidus basilensis OR16]